LGVFVFVKWEGKTETPVLNIDLFRNNRVFAFSNLATLIHFAATFALTFLLSLYLQYIKRLTPVDAGLILISQPIVQAFLAPLTGKISDRIEPRLVASVGMALTAVGLFVFTFLDNHTSQTVIVTNLVLLGVGCALFSSPNTNAVMSSVESRYYGVASGALGTMRVTGMTFSMGMTMLLFSLYIGKVQITPATYLPFLKCVRLAFTLFTGLCLAGMFASLARGKVR
jgi:nitrate/nitrite transporter NarK